MDEITNECFNKTGSKVSVKDYAARKKSLEDFISELEQLDVVVVIAAGNENEEKLEDRIPQGMGTTSNSIITVGGVDEDGQIWEHSTSQGSGGGSLTVFAKSKDLEMDLPFVGVRKIDGTSFAAPAVVSFRLTYLKLYRLETNSSFFPSRLVLQRITLVFLIQRNFSQPGACRRW